jgi:hypothetical protein
VPGPAVQTASSGPRIVKSGAGGRAPISTPPVWNKDPYIRIPPGRYPVRVVGFQGPEWMHNVRRWSLRVDCALEAEGEGNLSIFFNFGNNPGKIATPGRQSKYFKHWTMAKGEAPRRGESLDWAVFLDKHFMAEVEDAGRDSKGNQKCDAEIYSRISQFIRSETL